MDVVQRGWFKGGDGGANVGELLSDEKEEEDAKLDGLLDICHGSLKASGAVLNKSYIKNEEFKRLFYNPSTIGTLCSYIAKHTNHSDTFPPPPKKKNYDQGGGVL